MAADAMHAIDYLRARTKESVNCRLHSVERHHQEIDARLQSVFTEQQSLSALSDDEKTPATRFGPSTYLDYNVDLSKIKQRGTIMEYQENFEELSNMVRGWPVKALIRAFIGGLKDEIHIVVQATKPHSISDCFELARMVEQKHRKVHLAARQGTTNRGICGQSTRTDLFPQLAGMANPRGYPTTITAT
ncbi:hypothetical protein EJ110_NYTH16760 [Nymphaea thermarum]|nr:hypothetical protein EJ110_NYTH16760 [Nymphaea thermarum]